MDTDKQDQVLATLAHIPHLPAELREMAQNATTNFELVAVVRAAMWDLAERTRKEAAFFAKHGDRREAGLCLAQAKYFQSFYESLK